MERIICLDFDGVLCDSINECLLVSYNAYFNAAKKGIKDISENIRTYFYKYRFLVRRAGGYYIIFKAFEDNLQYLTYELFNKLILKYSFEIEVYEELFFKHRNKLKENTQEWLSMHNLFPNAIDFINEYKNGFFIITTKDRDSVEKISKYHNYYDQIIDIYATEINNNKRFLLEKLIKSYSINQFSTKLIYVDDNIEHLMDIRCLNIILYLAAWGYINGSGENEFSTINNLMEILK